MAGADADRILLTSEASEDEALEMIDAEAEARREDALGPTLSELTMLDNSELIDDEMADRTLEAAEAATPLVIVGVASVVLEAVVVALVLTPEASEDEALEVIDAVVDTRAEDTLGPTLSELTTLDESELIDVEAAEAAAPLVIVAVASVVLEARVGAPVPSVAVDAGKAVKLELLLVTEELSVADAKESVPVAVIEALSVAVAEELSVEEEPLVRGATILLKRSPD